MHDRPDCRLRTRLQPLRTRNLIQQVKFRALQVDYSGPRPAGAGGPLKLVVTVLLGLTLAAVSGCSAGAVPRKEGAKGPAPTVPAGGVLLRGAGATFPSALYEKWFSVYQSGHPKAVIAYEPVGSGEGVRRFVGQHVDDEERVDFGASDAAMRDDEMAAVPGGAVLALSPGVSRWHNPRLTSQPTRGRPTSIFHGRSHLPIRV